MQNWDRKGGFIGIYGKFYVVFAYTDYTVISLGLVIYIFLDEWFW